ncbi:MAG: hypothetical protein ACRCS0_14605 [Albidovulum sp.]
MKNPINPQTPLDREAHTRRAYALTELLNSSGWAHVAERLRRRQADLVTQVMAESTRPEDVSSLRKLHAEIGGILAMPETDRSISQREIDRAVTH